MGSAQQLVSDAVVGPAGLDGAYLTDGERLFYVTGASGKLAWLEDCGAPQRGSAPWSIRELRSAGMRFVRK